MSESPPPVERSGPWAEQLWFCLGRVVGVFRIIRFGILIPALLILMLVVSDQMVDALMAITDKASGDNVARWRAVSAVRLTTYRGLAYA
jgi:hypothetical protein